MPKYFYTAKSLDSKTTTGTAIAEDIHELSKILKNEGLFLVKADTKNSNIKKWTNFSFSSKVSSSEKIVFAKSLAVMMATGLSLVKSFDVLANQSKNRNLKNALLLARDNINKGESMSLALSKHPEIFSDFFLSMIKVGEESGSSEEVLKILALQLEKEHKLKSVIRGAMIYPVIILSLMLVVGIIIAIVVLPRLKQFFISLNSEIPFSTKLLINFGDFSVSHWPLLIIVPIVFVILFIAALKTKTGKWCKDTFLLKVPIFSSLVKENSCAILIRSLSSLLSSGVSLTRSLEVTAGTVGNYYFRKAINSALEEVKRGESLSGAFSLNRDIFPYGAIEMLEVGEETGKTAVVLKSLAEFYEDEVISAAAKLSAVIEPVLMIFLGAVVALFAFSIIEPMYSSLGAIN